MKISAAMVLAAGRGSRMQPLSRVLPKPALPLPDGPVIGSALLLAAASNPRRIVVNTWHLAHEMERAVSEVGLETEIAISREDQLMDTAGGIALARDRGLLGDRGPVLVINGDGMFNLELGPLFERMAHTDDLVSLALLPHLDPFRWSRVTLDTTGAIGSIKKAGAPDLGEPPFLYPGVMLISRPALDTLAARPGAVSECLWGPALAEKRLGGAVVPGKWREVGTPSDYLDAVLGQLDGNGSVHPSAEVHPSASIGSALIGRGARIEAQAAVKEAIIAEGASVGPRARVERSVLLGGVRAEAAETVIEEFRAKPPKT